MEDIQEEETETYEEVKTAVDVSESQDVEYEDEPKEEKEKEPKPKPKSKPKAQPKAQSKEPVAKPGKNDKVECENCGKTMSANTLRYKHVCKPAKSEEIQKEKPRRVPEPRPSEVRTRSYSPESPRAKMVKYYREARLAQQSQKRAMYASWLGN